MSSPATEHTHRWHGQPPPPERDVLRRVAAGKSNAEIAADLNLSVAAVKTHLSRLLDKLNCRNRAQLVVVAYETGVTVPGQR